MRFSARQKAALVYPEHAEIISSDLTKIPGLSYLSGLKSLFSCAFRANLSLCWRNSPRFRDLYIQSRILHELGLIQNLIEIAEAHARREGASAIRSLTLKIGSLSGVSSDAIEFAFDVCSKGTLAQGATLEILHIQALGHCRQCAAETLMESLADGCPKCGSFALEILQGQELALTEMEID